MAKKMYVGVDGTARKVKKFYAGSGGLARKVRRGYIGVGGVARPFFSGGEPTYIGEYGAGTAPRRYTAATSVGDYALFGGGHISSGPVSTVTAMSKNLVVSTATSMGHAALQLMAASVGGYALFAGGAEKYTGSPIYPKAGVSAYDANLTRTTQTSLTTARGRGAGLSTGTYALFGGGATSSGSNSPTGTMDAYDAMLVKTNPGIMVGRSSYAAAMAGSYAVFAGGTSDGKKASGAVNGFNSELVSVLADVLGQARAMLAGASVGKGYALFFGGTTTYSSSSAWATLYKRLEAYNTRLIRFHTVDVTQAVAVREPVGGKLGDYGIFAGGVSFRSVEDGEGGSSTELEYSTKCLAYNDTLVPKEISGTLHTGTGGSCASVDDYLVFGLARKSSSSGNAELRVVGLI